MSIFKGRFSVSTLVASMALAGIVDFAFTHSIDRNPSSANEGIEFSIQSLNLDPASRLKAANNVFLRATFNQKNVYEFGKSEGWSLTPGEKKPLDILMKIPPEWIKHGELEFKLELVKNATFTPILVRCAQISKQLDSYNRSYQCNIPGEGTPLLVYRVGRKPEEAISVAQVAAPKSAVR